MAAARETIRIDPTPGYVFRPAVLPVIEPDPAYRASRPISIVPDSSYRPPSLHAAAAAEPGLVRNVRARWCPVCHSPESDIRETETADGPKWICDVCGHRW